MYSPSTPYLLGHLAGLHHGGYLPFSSGLAPGSSKPPMAMMAPGGASAAAAAALNAGKPLPKTATVSPLNKVPSLTNGMPAANSGAAAFGANRTSSFAAALRKLAHQTKDSGEDDPEGKRSDSPSLPQSARPGTPKRSSHHSAFSSHTASASLNSPPVVTIAPTPSHNNHHHHPHHHHSSAESQQNPVRVPSVHLSSSYEHSKRSDREQRPLSSHSHEDDHAQDKTSLLARNSSRGFPPTSSMSNGVSMPSPALDMYARGFHHYRPEEELARHGLQLPYGFDPATYAAAAAAAAYHPALLQQHSAFAHSPFRLDDPLLLERYRMLQSPYLPFPATASGLLPPHMAATGLGIHPMLAAAAAANPHYPAELLHQQYAAYLSPSHPLLDPRLAVQAALLERSRYEEAKELKEREQEWEREHTERERERAASVNADHEKSARHGPHQDKLKELSERRDLLNVPTRLPLVLDRERERERERDRERERERGRERDRVREQEHGRERDRVREQEHGRERERVREHEHSSERVREILKGQDHPKDRGKESDWERERALKGEAHSGHYPGILSRSLSSSSRSDGHHHQGSESRDGLYGSLKDPSFHHQNKTTDAGLHSQSPRDAFTNKAHEQLSASRQSSHHPYERILSVPPSSVRKPELEQQSRVKPEHQPFNPAHPAEKAYPNHLFPHYVSPSLSASSTSTSVQAEKETATLFRPFDEPKRTSPKPENHSSAQSHVQSYRYLNHHLASESQQIPASKEKQSEFARSLHEHRPSSKNPPQTVKQPEVLSIPSVKRFHQNHIDADRPSTVHSDLEKKIATAPRPIEKTNPVAPSISDRVERFDFKSLARECTSSSSYKDFKEPSSEIPARVMTEFDAYPSQVERQSLSKLDLQEKRLKEARRRGEELDSDQDAMEEEKLIARLTMVQRCTPLPFEASEEKLAFLANLNLTTRARKRELDRRKEVRRRKQLRLSSVSPVLRMQDDTKEFCSNVESLSSMAMKLLLNYGPIALLRDDVNVGEKKSFLNQLSLLPVPPGPQGAYDRGIKRKHQELVARPIAMNSINTGYSSASLPSLPSSSSLLTPSSKVPHQSPSNPRYLRQRLIQPANHSTLQPHNHSAPSASLTLSNQPAMRRDSGPFKQQQQRFPSSRDFPGNFHSTVFHESQGGSSSSSSKSSSHQLKPGSQIEPQMLQNPFQKHQVDGAGSLDFNSQQFNHHMAKMLLESKHKMEEDQSRYEAALTKLQRGVNNLR